MGTTRDVFTSKGFIKDLRLLEERSDIEDLLDCGNLCDSFVKKIRGLNGASIIALVGPFGSGKSTMLNNIQFDKKKELVFEFDAWKYPDRKDLWEGFVLDLVKSINPKATLNTKKEIEGKQNNDKKTLIKVLSKIPGFAVLEGFNHFLETSPAKRVEDVQKIFSDQLNSIKKDLYIIVEDIDRSGDAGVFFLETFKQFLKSNLFKRKICIIVPIANDNYHKNIDSYLKCIDYFDLALDHQTL